MDEVQAERLIKLVEQSVEFQVRAQEMAAREAVAYREHATKPHPPAPDYYAQAERNHANHLKEWDRLREERVQARRHATATEILAAWHANTNLELSIEDRPRCVRESVEMADALLDELERTRGGR